MPTGKIPFGSAVVKNTDEEFLPENCASLFDGYLTEAGVTVKRFALSEISSLSSPTPGFCNGMFWWAAQKKLVYVANNKVFVITKTGATTYSSVDVTNAIPNSTKVTFAYDASYFYIADGGKIMYSAGLAADLTDIADADAPTSCTHVSYLDGYIIGNNGNRRFYYSTVEDGLTWSSLDFASASGNPDNIIGQVVYNRQIFLIGEQTTEIWYNDGETPFARNDGGFIERGCIAPYSILKTKIGVIWLDNERNLVISNGGVPEVISLDFQSMIESLSIVYDCESHFIEWKGRQFIILNFRLENRTFVYNVTQKNWSEWGSWDSTSSSYNMWRAQNLCWCPDWGLWVAGDRYVNSVYSFSDSQYTDAGRPIRLYKKTGFINHGSDSLKRSNRITLKVKRGYGAITSSTSPKLMIRCRNDGTNDWGNLKEVDLGKAGDGVHVVDVYLRGAYYTRQYELSCSDNVPIAFLDAEEDYTVLR